MTDAYDDLPLVYSCSGCSSAAQLANDLAVTLDRDGVAKEYHADYDDEDAERLRELLVEEIEGLEVELEGAT